MKSKLLLFLLSVVILLSGCDKDDVDDTQSIIVPNREQLTQTVYADDHTGKSSVTFTSNSSWTSKITETVKGKSTPTTVDWVSITPSSGDKAGEYTVQISLATNLTGERRSANIDISCNGKIETITVTQEATTESGEKPNPTPTPSGSGVLTNEQTHQSVKLIRATHTIFAPEIVRIAFTDQEEGNETFLADFYNPLQNGKLKSGVYTVRAINTPPYPEMKHGDCGWYKSILGGYGETGTIKVELNNDIYTFTFDINIGEGEYAGRLTGSFTGVPQYLNQEVKVESITLNESEKTLEMGENFTLGATVLPENATNKNFKWSSNNVDVAKVDDYGVVQSVGKGTATITATTQDGGKTAACIVTVNPPVAVESIDIAPAIINLLKGDRYDELVITVAPENAYNKNYTWKSGNPDIASYDGKSIEAKAPGETTITFTTDDGAKTATLIVKVGDREISGNGTLTVTDPNGKYEEEKHALIEATHTVISKTQVELSLKDNNGNAILSLRFSNPLSNGRLAAGNYNCVLNESGANNTVYSYAMYQSMGYLSSGIVVVSTDNDNYTFTLNGVETSNGFIVSGSYTGKPVYTNEYFEVGSVKLNENSKNLTLGESYSGLIATVLPENAFNKKISWNSSHPNIVTVDNNGILFAGGVGTATITATTEDGGKTAECVVTVNPKTATGNGTFTNNSGQSVTINRAVQWVNEKNPAEIEIGFYKVNSLYNDIRFTLVREDNDTGSLKEGVYTLVSNLEAGELGIKYSATTGTVTVTANGQEYTVRLDLTTTEGIKLTGTYTGNIPAS